MTIDLVLPHELAERIFGLYLFGVKEAADLSGFAEGSAFSEEISERLRRLPGDDLDAVRESLDGALAAG